MKVLFVSSWHPWPADNGSRLRVLHLLKALADSHRVALCVLHDEDTPRPPGPLETICDRIDQVARPRYRPASVRGLLGLASRQPRSLASTFDRRVERRLESIVAEVEPDVVVASELPAGAYRRALGHRPALLEDLEPGQYALRPGTALGGRLRHRLMRAKLARYLRSLLAGYSACTVVSERERRHLADLAPDYPEVFVIPNAVDLARYRPPPADVRNGLVFTGAMSYEPNREGLLWFLRQVLPRIRERVPDVPLRVTGDPGATDLAAFEGVEVLGHVQDVRPHIGEAAVAIVPVLSGGGTRLKLLEAMAMETAVVSTSKGAEGLDVEHGRHLLLADEPGALADATVRLLLDDRYRRTVARQGRRLAEARYDWRTVGADFVGLLERMHTREAGRMP